MFGPTYQAKYIVWVPEGFPLEHGNARDWTIFPEEISHVWMAEQLGVKDRVVSAGFFTGGKHPRASGSSYTLHKRSHPNDTRLILSGMVQPYELNEMLPKQDDD